MTSIPAEVVAAHKLVDQYHVIVRIGTGGYRGSFASLIFGDNKPLIGACHDRRLDLIYLQHPGFKAGQEFPLWTIQQPDRPKDDEGIRESNRELGPELIGLDSTLVSVCSAAAGTDGRAPKVEGQAALRSAVAT